MRILDVIRCKGAIVVMIRLDDIVCSFFDFLVEYCIGVLVVFGDGNVVDGIVSECDVVRYLYDAGVDVFD